MPVLDLSYEELADWLDEEEIVRLYGLSAWEGGGGGRAPVTFPAVRLHIRVEIFLNGSWVDVSQYVKYEDRIVITRGRRNEQGKVPPSVCSLTFLNSDRRFSPRNTTSPNYPYLGQNTPLRVWFNPGSGDSLRFTGEVPDWAPQWTTGDDRSVSVVASGRLRRLGQGTEPAYSATRRSYDNDVVQPVAYWPLEGGQDTTILYDTIGNAPTRTGGFAFTDGTAGVARFGVGDLGPGSDRVVNVSGGWTLDLDLPQGVTATGQVTIEFSMSYGTIVRTGTYTGCGIRMHPNTATRHIKFNVFVNDSGLIEVQWLEAGQDFSLLAGPTTVYSAGSENIFDGQPRVFHLDLAASGGTNVVWTLYENDVQLGTGTVTPSFAGAMNAPPYRASAVSITSATADAILGHFAVYTTNIAANRYSALTGHSGELPTTRFARLCTEEGIPYVVNELVADTVGMGPQTISPPLELLRACEEANEGLIDETRANELRLSSRTARWVPDVLLTLDYAHPTHGNQVYRMKPTDDDFPLINDWTIDRDGGLSAHAQQTSGALNVNDPEGDPINGVGRKKDSETLSLSTDAQLADHAHWRLRKGTVDEPRYPSIEFRLDTHPELIPSWLALDISGRMQVLNPPSDVGPGTIAQYAEGYTEEADQFTWTVGVNASPVATGEAWHYNDPTGAAVYDCAGSTLSAAVTSGATTLNLTITDNCVWAHDFGDYTIRVGGEDMTVTAVGAASGSLGSQSQALTVTRSVNGAILEHAAGVAVRLKRPARYAL